ncbi:MAG: hypothetical protein R6X13_01825 [bacterium]
MDSIELRELKRTVAGTDNSDTIALFRRRKAPGAVINAKGDAFRWWAAPVSDGVRRLLPGVRFFHEEHHTYSNPDGPYHSSVAVYKDRRYGLQSLNRFLVDCGYRFDTTEIPAVAKIAVLWTLLDRQARLHIDPGPKALALGVPPPDSAARATAIPAVTFRKIERRPISILVEVDIAGELAAVEVGLTSGTCIPQFMSRDGKPWGAWFDWIRPPGHGPDAPPAPQK